MSACATFVRQHNIIGGSRARPQRHTRVRCAAFVRRPHRKCARAIVYKEQVDECTLARFVLETRLFSYAFRSGVAIRREITWKRTKYAHWIQYFRDMYAECIKSNEMLNGQISDVHSRAPFFFSPDFWGDRPWKEQNVSLSNATHKYTQENKYRKRWWNNVECKAMAVEGKMVIGRTTDKNE